MRVLYHVTLLIKRPNGSKVRGDVEERIYTRFGKTAATRLERKLRERWPGCAIDVAKQSPEVRQPIC